MKTKAIKLSVLALGLTLGLQGTTAWADDCNKPEYQALLKIKNPGVIPHINDLGLTQDQQTQFKTMKEKFDVENNTNMDKMKSIIMQLTEMIPSRSMNEDKIDSLLLDLKNNAIAGRTQLAIFRHNLYMLLNDTQKAKYQTLQQQERQFFQMNLQCPDIAKKLSLNRDPFDRINELNLTDEQKAKIMPIIQANQDQARKSMLALNNGDMSFNQMERQIVQSPSAIDTKKLNDFVTAQADSFAELQKQRDMAYVEIYGYLNADQQTRFMGILKDSHK